MRRERVCTCSEPMQLIFCQIFLIHGWWNSQMQKPWIPSFHLCLDNYVATCQIKFFLKDLLIWKVKQSIEWMTERERQQPSLGQVRSTSQGGISSWPPTCVARALIPGPPFAAWKSTLEGSLRGSRAAGDWTDTDRRWQHSKRQGNPLWHSVSPWQCLCNCFTNQSVLS